MFLSFASRRLCLSALLVAPVLAAVPASFSQQEDPIRQLLDRDAIPAIRNPKFVSAENASIRPDERVLGVVGGGEARAYPLIDLDRHEVVDDRVGGKPIAATW